MSQSVEKKTIRKIAKEVIQDGYTDKRSAEDEVKARCLRKGLLYDGVIVAWCVERELNSHLYKRVPEGYGWS